MKPPVHAGHRHARMGDDERDAAFRLSEHPALRDESISNAIRRIIAAAPTGAKEGDQ